MRQMHCILVVFVMLLNMKTIPKSGQQQHLYIMLEKDKDFDMKAIAHEMANKGRSISTQVSKNI